MEEDWSKEKLENLSLSVSSGTSSAYSVSRSISLSTSSASRDDPIISTMVCSFTRNPKSSKRVSIGPVRGRERRWTSAALLRNLSIEANSNLKRMKNTQVVNLSSNVGSGSSSSPPLSRTPLNRPPLSTSTMRSISTPQVPLSATPSTSQNHTGTEMGPRRDLQDERERLASPCSDLLRGRSISIEARNQQASTSQEQSSFTHEIQEPPSEDQERSESKDEGIRLPNEARQSEGEDDDDHEDEEELESSSSASSFSDLRGRSGKNDTTDLRSPRSRKQEVLPWLSGTSPISSPEIGVSMVRFNGNLEKSDQTGLQDSRRGRDVSVRPPIGMEDYLKSNDTSLTYPHRTIFSKTFEADTSVPVSPSIHPRNSFENDPIFDEVNSRIKDYLERFGSKSGESLFYSPLSLIWEDRKVREACKGQISSLLDAIRLVDPSEEEVMLDSQAMKQSAESLGRMLGSKLVGSDGRKWQLRLSIPEKEHGQGSDLVDLDRDLLLVLLDEVDSSTTT